MIFRIRFHDRARAELGRWRAMLGDTPTERGRWYRTLLRVMADHLRRHGGRPPEAAPGRPRPDGRRVYWWYFARSVLVEYLLDEMPPKPRGWWDVGRMLTRLLRRREVTVTVIGLTPVAGRPAG